MEEALAREQEEKEEALAREKVEAEAALAQVEKEKEEALVRERKGKQSAAKEKKKGQEGAPQVIFQGGVGILPIAGQLWRLGCRLGWCPPCHCSICMHATMCCSPFIITLTLTMCVSNPVVSSPAPLSTRSAHPNPAWLPRLLQTVARRCLDVEATG